MNDPQDQLSEEVRKIIEQNSGLTIQEIAEKIDRFSWINHYGLRIDLVHNLRQNHILPLEQTGKIYQRKSSDGARWYIKNPPRKPEQESALTPGEQVLAFDDQQWIDQGQQAYNKKQFWKLATILEINDNQTIRIKWDDGNVATVHLSHIQKSPKTADDVVMNDFDILEGIRAICAPLPECRLLRDKIIKALETRFKEN